MACRAQRAFCRSGFVGTKSGVLPALREGRFLSLAKLPEKTMRSLLLGISSALVGSIMMFPFAHASDEAPKQAAPKPAIILASFGSTVKEARDAEAAFVSDTEKRYPGVHVVLANTSRIVMRKNAEQGIKTPSLYRALADLADQRYTHVAVQSLHLIPGKEFEGVTAIAKAQENLPKGLTAVSVGAPLLASNEDCERAVAILAASLPKDRKAADPVIFIGHGTHHGIGGMVYPTLQWHMAQRDPNVFVSTIEGTPAMEDTLKILGKPSAKKAVIWLAPLLGLAGDHAVNDLYGDEDDSWKSVLTKEGWQVKELSSPLYAIPGIRDLWFAHLDAALEELGVPLEKE